MMTRRHALGGGMAVALGAVAGGDTVDAAHAQPALGGADLSHLRREPLVNADRARHFMRAEGLDALVVAKPANVFYLTNHWPQLDRMGFEGSAIAIFPRDPKRPVALVMHAFLYYYTHSPESDFREREVFLYTQPVASPPGSPEAEPSAGASLRLMPVVEEELVSAREWHRRSMVSDLRPPSADASWALASALRALGLTDATLGIDTATLADDIRRRGIGAEIREAENTLRRVRLVKSSVEVALMRSAAEQNAAAAMAAARRVREFGSTRQLRATFFAEAAMRGNIGHFMIIDGSSSEVLDEPIHDGMALSIDCVSTFRHYHGDFGRTIFVGEPNARMRGICNAIALAWQDIQEALRPGLRFADIPQLGRESLRKQGMSLNVGFTPHSVGLFHTDHPQPSLVGPRVPEALVLEENMILSVDCPVFEAGLGGTAHLEDLMLITAEGAEPIHAVPEPVIVV